MFVKKRHHPTRVAYNVRFTDSQGMRKRFTASLMQGDGGAWQVMGGAGGSAQGSPENAPTRGHREDTPGQNLGCGGGPRQNDLTRPMWPRELN